LVSGLRSQFQRFSFPNFRFLEVVAGFHPERISRENIFLNGAILGMSRVEMRKKFDQNSNSGKP